MRRRLLGFSIAAALFLAAPLCVPDHLLAGTVTRGTKAGGGTDFQDGQTIEASEVNTDFNTLYNLVNGNLDGDNIGSVPWSDLTGTKNPEDIDDTSGTTTERDTDQDPGTHASGTLATDLEDELQQLRYVTKRMTLGASPERRDGTPANVAVAWIEPPARGQSWVLNGRFDIYTGDSSSQDPPDSWTKVGSPTTMEQVAKSAAEGAGNAAHFVANASGNGLRQTVDGLKADTKYLLLVRAKVTTSDTLNIATTNSSGTDYDDVVDTITATSYTTVSHVILTDSTPTDIQIDLTLSGSSEEAWISDCLLIEMGDDVVADGAGGYTVQSTLATETTVGSTFADITSLEAAIIFPGPDYEVVVSVDASFGNDTANRNAAMLRITENGSAVGGLGVDSMEAAANTTAHVTAKAVRSGLTTGTTYTYKAQALRSTAAQSINISPVISTGAAGNVQAVSTLTVAVRRRGS